MGKRGAFYETAGCLRDVIQNHLFQVIALLAMEPPSGRDFGAVHMRKPGLQAMRPLKPDDLVAASTKATARNRMWPRTPTSRLSRLAAFHRLMAVGGRALVRALRQIPGRNRNRDLSGTETATTETFRGLTANFKDGPGNYLRFRLSPNAAIALAARVKFAGKEFVGDQRELYLFEEQAGEDALRAAFGDAMIGDGALFTREDAVEAAWAVVEPVLKNHHRRRPYRRDSWCPNRLTRSSLQTAPGTTPNRGKTSGESACRSHGSCLALLAAALTTQHLSV